MPTNPQYCAAKHALVGLTRSVGSKLGEENITVNCIYPAFVPTNLCSPHMLSLFPKEHITPMNTVLKAIDRVLEDGKLTGEILELSLDQIYSRKQPDWPNESQRWLGEESAAFWTEAYKTVPKNP
ncbi:15-hydroxyprostaglandin dehydrogenase (NAD) [Cladophialophora psammophila CBS 110553]|uniref:15-hydroxyprostaglandin dehydrogenase (NAD) n=1 Tax=Cladophialophora psammophila CBS 110553 TaxID=1182543 RepID=W9XGE2_9EURO|nr:15-hydroxyprostaglandin dehydrogenase (NAD) [Cladophialophora psammophila CBS 110553]EXJ76395.1 15-hydroxyprostaglandin dehydrogenase (NAD) [Cladophialophora psammophila CBS 110553]